MTKWIKQYASKRWHKMRKGGTMTLCGKRAIPTKEADAPPGWHLACGCCLRVLDSNLTNAKAANAKCPQSINRGHQ